MINRLLPLISICLTLMLSAAARHKSQSAVVRNLEFKHVPSELLIKFKDGYSDKYQSMILDYYGGKSAHRFRASLAQLVRFTDAKDNGRLIKIAHAIASEESVEYVEANSVLNAIAIPNDPMLNELYGLHNTGQNDGTGDADIDAPEAWDKSTGSRDVLVGIIDTGINWEHPDLAPNIWSNPGETGTDGNGADKKTNGVDDDANGFVDDWRGWDFVNNDNDPMDDNGHYHGSHCAGTIGGAGNNDFGVVGVNWQVSLVGIKFLSASGSGSLADAIKAIEYTNTIQVDVSSNSWGGGGFSQPMYDAIEESRQKDIIFIAASGNDSSNTDDAPHYPSSYVNDNVVSVAATDKNDDLAVFSNFGIRSVDLSAPGVDIVSCSTGSDFQSLSGTSMATPHVAGAAALIKSVFPNISYSEVKSRLFNGVDRIETLGSKVKYGGRLNIANSIETDEVIPSKVLNINITEQFKTSIDLSWNHAGDDGDQGFASSYVLRYAETPILTAMDWDYAISTSLVNSGTPEAPSGSVDGFRFNYSGYLAIRAVDNVGNIGAISDSIAFTVKHVDVVYQNISESMDGVSVDGKWGLEELEGRPGQVFSDTPGEWYENDYEASLTLDQFQVESDELTLVYVTRTEVEKGYDFGFVELSVDNGSSWRELEKITGTKDWHLRMIDLKKHLNGQTNFKIRFRIVTDYVLQSDGWFIDEISLIKEAK